MQQKAWMKKHQRLLDKRKIEKLVLTLRAIPSSNSEVAEKLRIETNYFERNAERMRYPSFAASTCSSAPASSKRGAGP